MKFPRHYITTRPRMLTAIRMLLRTSIDTNDKSMLSTLDKIASKHLTPNEHRLFTLRRNYPWSDGSI